MNRSDLPTRLVFLAEAEDFLGISESGGSNLGPAVEWFQRLGMIQPGQPWCAAFVNACAEIACAKKDIVSPLEAVPLQGFVQSYYSHSVSRAWTREAPGIGDLFMVWHNGKGRYAHIGIVRQVFNEGFSTVEGNSNSHGSREGIEVCSNFRPFSIGVVFSNPWGDL